MTARLKPGNIIADPFHAEFNAAGQQDFLVPSSGKRLLVLWLYFQAAGALLDGVVQVTVKFESDPPEKAYRFELTGSQPWSHTIFRTGNVDEKLVVIPSSNALIYADADYRVVDAA